jgi:hypothetical protein
MSITLTLKIVGEIWHNPSDIEQQLASFPLGQDVVLDINSEGPALAPFGIFELLKKYPHNYSFTKWSNPVEPTPYPRFECSEISHFFRMSWRYWTDDIENTLAPCALGLFVGRNSTARNYIIYDVSHHWKEHFLLSKMIMQIHDVWAEKFPTESVIIDSLDRWASAEEYKKIKEWWENPPISSIDGVNVKDYYREPEISSAACATSLLSYYNQFNIELICETFTYGTTFFPTEKTVRTIIGNKPFLVYGPRNYLKNLKDLGFETFDQWWDESYDNHEGPARWNAMRPVIDAICSWDDDKRQSVIEECKTITQHNKKRVRELINDYRKF